MASLSRTTVRYPTIVTRLNSEGHRRLPVIDVRERYSWHRGYHRRFQRYFGMSRFTVRHDNHMALSAMASLERMLVRQTLWRFIAVAQLHQVSVVALLLNGGEEILRWQRPVRVRFPGRRAKLTVLGCPARKGTRLDPLLGSPSPPFR